jgi:hypothetical protein
MGDERWEERTSGSPFIGSEGEWGGWASQRIGRRHWCAIMALKVAVLEWNRRGSDGGGENMLRPLWKRKGERRREAVAHA